MFIRKKSVALTNVSSAPVFRDPLSTLAYESRIEPFLSANGKEALKFGRSYARAPREMQGLLIKDKALEILQKVKVKLGEEISKEKADMLDVFFKEIAEIPSHGCDLRWLSQFGLRLGIALTTHDQFRNSAKDVFWFQSDALQMPGFELDPKKFEDCLKAALDKESNDTRKGIFAQFLSDFSDTFTPIPVVGNLSYIDISALMGMGFWPYSINTKDSIVDGVKMTPYEAVKHDFDHQFEVNNCFSVEEAVSHIPSAVAVCKNPDEVKGIMNMFFLFVHEFYISNLPARLSAPDPEGQLAEIDLDEQAQFLFYSHFYKKALWESLPKETRIALQDLKCGMPFLERKGPSDSFAWKGLEDLTIRNQAGKLVYAHILSLFVLGHEIQQRVKEMKLK